LLFTLHLHFYFDYFKPVTVFFFCPDDLPNPRGKICYFVRIAHVSDHCMDIVFKLATEVIASKVCGLLFAGRERIIPPSFSTDFQMLQA